MKFYFIKVLYYVKKGCGEINGPIDLPRIRSLTSIESLDVKPLFEK